MNKKIIITKKEAEIIAHLLYLNCRNWNAFPIGYIDTINFFRHQYIKSYDKQENYVYYAIKTGHSIIRGTNENIFILKGESFEIKILDNLKKYLAIEFDDDVATKIGMLELKQNYSNLTKKQLWYAVSVLNKAIKSKVEPHLYIGCLFEKLRRAVCQPLTAAEMAVLRKILDNKSILYYDKFTTDYYFDDRNFPVNIGVIKNLKRNFRIDFSRVDENKDLITASTSGWHDFCEET